MKPGRPTVVRLVAALALLTLAVLVTSCGSFGGDQNTFAPSGEVAKGQKDLFLLVMWIGLVVMIGVFGACIYVLIRYRRRSEDELPKQIHGNTRLELAWTIAPALVLAGLAVPTVLGIIDLGKSPGEAAFDVRVTAFQWDWRFEYLDPEYLDAEGAPMAGKACPEEVGEPACMYIPVDRDVAIDIEALDVNHSFWIPKLAGKQDAIPGRTNDMWLRADEEGVFRGQCAEFCGIGHPTMRMAIVALEEDRVPACLEALVAQEDLGVCLPQGFQAEE